MKKIIIPFVLVIFIACLYGCSEIEAEKPKNNNGIYTSCGVDSYIFKLPQGKSVRDFFSFTEGVGTIVADFFEISFRNWI